MYEVVINKNVSHDAYNKLIDYAFVKSDAFMLVVYRYCQDLKIAFKLPDRRLFESDELYSMVVKSIKSAKDEKYKQNIIFKKSTEVFLKEINPFLVKSRCYPTIWPGVATVFDENTSVDINIYKICEEVKPYLYKAGGLFNWVYPYFPDDLSFFKNGYCWFYTVSHENYANIYVNNQQDIKNLLKLGIEFNVNEYTGNELSPFYEDYELYQ
jgi:hypothetical protein